jgi:hypothetical protein
VPKPDPKKKQQEKPVEHTAVPLSAPPAREKAAEDVAAQGGTPPTTEETPAEQQPADPGMDRRMALAKLVEQAHKIASGQGDKHAVGALEELSEHLKTMVLDEAGFQDIEKYLRETIAGLQERAVALLEQSQLSSVERDRLAEPKGSPKRDPDEAARPVQREPEPAQPADKQPMAEVAEAADKLERVAHAARAASTAETEDYKAALEHVRSVAQPGETLEKAVERLKALAEVGRGVLKMLGKDTSTRISGVIVEDCPEEGNAELHKVHIFERDAGEGSPRLWAWAKGEKMPWHAARDIVYRVVETRITPEEKR